MNPQERRRSQRFEVTQAIEIVFPKEKFISVKGINISHHGILLESNQPIDLCARIYLMLKLSKGKEEFSCEGLVVRSEPKDSHYLVAIEFIDIDPSVLDSIL